MLSNIYTKPLIDFLIVTYNNNQQLLGTVQSLFENSHPRPFRVLVANNGTPKSIDSLNNSEIKVFDIDGNKGWEGGINSLLPHVDADYLCLMNDDIHIPPNDPAWILKILDDFRDPTVGAVGPSSNYVMQKQNMFWMGIPRKMNVPVLIGFCMFIRTSLFKQLGGLTENMPGGDDLDLSIRIEKMGYKLRCNRNVFVFHHGAQTGRKVHGKYWDSEEHQDKVNNEVIKRNGLKEFHRCRFGPHEDASIGIFNGLREDAEGQIVKNFVIGDKILELGCGGRKTIENSIGVDVFPKGTPIPSLGGVCDSNISVADIVATVDNIPLPDSSQDTIIARHLFEHLIDPTIHLKEWGRLLKVGGRLILAVPDQEVCHTIPLNIEHVHAYTKDSLSNLIKIVLPNFKKIICEYANNGMSFVGVYERET